MEKKVLKWMTGGLGVLTIVVCLGFGLGPEFKDNIATSANKKTEQNIEKNTEENTQQVVDKETESTEEVLVVGDVDIKLPADVTEEDVEIVNDYANRIVYVRFAKPAEGYSKKQVKKGDCDYISSISYTEEGEDEENGVVAITLNAACEHTYSFEDGHLYMDFTDVHELYDKIVVIDAGHGGSEPGAIRKEIYEKKINLEIVLRIKELFDEVDEKEVKVFYTRTEDKHVSLQDRAALANSLQADLFISIHSNSQGEEEFNDVSGTLVLFSQGGLKESRSLAQKCLNHVIDQTGSKNQGLVEGDYVYIVRTSEVPVALIEVGFMTNERELDNLASVSYQKKLAKGVYDAIMESLEEGL